MLIQFIKMLSEINTFEIEIDDIKYIINFNEKPDKIYKNKLPNHIYKTFIRIYNNISCINKLRDGLIRKYQLYNKLELEVLIQYLKNKCILFRIIEENIYYTRKYSIFDKSYKFCFDYKVIKPTKMYIEIYKGFINLTEIKYNKNVYKYGIYLY
jgi:hypothetical protein